MRHMDDSIKQFLQIDLGAGNSLIMPVHSIKGIRITQADLNQSTEVTASILHSMGHDSVIFENIQDMEARMIYCNIPHVIGVHRDSEDTDDYNGIFIANMFPMAIAKPFIEEGVMTVGDLLKLPYKDLINVSNIGSIKLRKIFNELINREIQLPESWIEHKDEVTGS